MKKALLTNEHRNITADTQRLIDGQTVGFAPCRYFLIIFVVILVACGSIPTELVGEIPSTTLIATATPVVETPPVLPIFTSFPTSESTPTTPTPAVVPISISTASETFPLDNLRMAYIVDGNLYIQNGSNSPKQLSNSAEDLSPMFSDDGEKIVFSRGKIHDNHSIFSINADGSHEQELITTDWLDTLGAETKAGHLAFVPNTHQILFNTYLCPEDNNSSSGCTVGLFLADADRGKLKEIVAPTLGGYLPWGGDSRWPSNFSISPDGNLLSVAHAGQIDILDMDGNVIHHSIMKYSPDMPFELYPRVYWLSDSSGLIAALPAEIDYRGSWDSGDPDYTIWRYTFDDNVATQIPLEPSPSWMHMESNDVISISPNREWVVYFSNDCQLYKGNLLDGSTDLLLPCRYFLPMQWSSNSMHFASDLNPEESILGSVSAPPNYAPGYFLGWIDAKRFIYIPTSAFMSKEDVHVLVGEVNKDTLLSYETNVTVPLMIYFTSTIIGGK